MSHSRRHRLPRPRLLATARRVGKCADGVEASGFGLAVCKTLAAKHQSLAAIQNLPVLPQPRQAIACSSSSRPTPQSTTLTLARSLIKPSARNQQPSRMLSGTILLLAAVRPMP